MCDATDQFQSEVGLPGGKKNTSSYQLRVGKRNTGGGNICKFKNNCQGRLRKRRTGVDVGVGREPFH